MSGVVRPSRTDPVVTAASESIGGPVGDHAAGHWWWTPVRVVLRSPRWRSCWAWCRRRRACATTGPARSCGTRAMCYSDVPYLYTGRGLRGRLPALHRQRRPVPGHGVPRPHRLLRVRRGDGHPALSDGDVAARRLVPGDRVYAQPGVGAESSLYFVVTAVLLAPFALLAAWFLSGVHRRRPWDAMLFAASPALVLSGLVNWDLLAVAAVAGALWAWSRDRPVLAGVLIGLGTAVKLYPLFLLGALLVVCLRRGRMRAFAATAAAAVLAWLAVNLPAMLTAFDQWKVFWTFNDERGADLGSVWLVWQQMGHTVTPGLVNAVSLVFFGAVCLGVLVLGLRARRTPRIPQLALPGRGRLPGGQQGVLAAVRPLAAAARRARPAALARRADLDRRRGVLLRQRLALPRRAGRRPGRAASRTGSTGWRSRSGWPRSSTSPCWWSATSCGPRTTRSAPTASPTTPPSPRRSHPPDAEPGRPACPLGRRRRRCHGGDRPAWHHRSLGTTDACVHSPPSL